MPEGPSIVILKEAAMIFKGKKVTEVGGNSKEDIQRMDGQKVIDMKSWGKHFLICFKGFTLRIHLMLFGSYRINEGKDAKPRLSLHFPNGELNFYACSVRIIDGPLKDVYDWEVDLMSDEWNGAKAKASLKALKDVPVCDALLDQNIFSGSGNIVKNEVLFRIKVHPMTMVENLPAAKLTELVKETHHYCWQFYEWKKEYTLSKHWLAYKQKICPRDHIPFLLKPLGRGKRRTFFCEACQVMYDEDKKAMPLKKVTAKDIVKKVPAKKSVRKAAAKGKQKVSTFEREH